MIKRLRAETVGREMDACCLAIYLITTLHWHEGCGWCWKSLLEVCGTMPSFTLPGTWEGKNVIPDTRFHFIFLGKSKYSMSCCLRCFLRVKTQCEAQDEILALFSTVHTLASPCSH